MLPFNAAEQRLIDRAVRYLHGDHIPGLDPDNSDAFKIGALRYFLGINERDGILRPSEADTTRVVLCKMIDNARQVGNEGAVRGYVVTVRRDPIMGLPMLQRLAGRYRTYQNSNGWGGWRMRTHESIMYTLCFPLLGGNRDTPTFFNRTAFMTMQQIYDDQVREAEAAAQEARSSVRDKLLSDERSDDLSVSVSERKRTAAEGRGKCFCCESPKKRGTTCRVCGYTPSRNI